MLPGGGNCLNPVVAPLPLRAGMLLPGTGLPMSPGAILLLGMDAMLLLSGSNLTNVPRGPSFLIMNEPPPFCGLPSVSQISSISLSVMGASFGEFNCSTDAGRDSRCKSQGQLCSG